MRRKNIPLNVYVDKDTIVHRLSPSGKLAIIIVFILATSIFIKTIPWALAAVAVGAIPYALAQVPPSIIASQLTPPLFILVPLAAFQWWSRDFEYAAVMFMTIFAAMEVAFLLTLTSTVDEIMESMERTLAPLARFGLPVETISLAMSLTIRLIPLMFETVGEVLDARKARGANMSVMAFATPVVIRSIRQAQAMGEALAARGVGD